MIELRKKLLTQAACVGSAIVLVFVAVAVAVVFVLFVVVVTSHLIFLILFDMRDSNTAA